MAGKRPPQQYIPASGTDFCLIPNQYDKNSYAQCSYVGNRTMIRCCQVRRKEDLQKTNGICEIHLDLSANIRKNFERQKMQLAADCPPSSVKKFYRILQNDEVVTEQDPALARSKDWCGSVAPMVNPKLVDKDIFSVAFGGVSTEKELLSLQMDILKKEIKMLEAYREKHRDTRRIKTDSLIARTKRPQKLIGLQAKSYFALRNQKKPTQEMIRLLSMSSGPYSDRRKICSYKMTESQIITTLLLDVVGKVAKAHDGSADGIPIPPTFCQLFAVPGTEHCLRHSEEGKLPFTTCEKCGVIVLLDGQKLCAAHQLALAPTKFMKSRSLKRPTNEITEVLIDSEDLKEVSKEQEFEKAKQSQSATAAAAKRRRPSNPMPRNSVSFTSITPTYQTVQGMVSQERTRAPRSLVNTMDSARCRPFNRENFGHKEYPSTSTVLPVSSNKAPLRSPTTPVHRLQNVPGGLPGVIPVMDMSVRSMSTPRGTTQTYTAAAAVRLKPPPVRISLQDRARNRLQQEEDNKAAASIADDRTISPATSEVPQFRTVHPGGNPQYRVVNTVGRGAPYPSLVGQQSVDINNMSEEMKNTPLGAILKSGVNIIMRQPPTGSVNTPVMGTPRTGQTIRVITPGSGRRLSAQTVVRRADGGYVLPSSMMASSVSTTTSQRHQIATVEVPTSRPAMAPPHRIARPTVVLAAPPPASAPPRPTARAAPKMIPLEPQTPVAKSNSGERSVPSAPVESPVEPGSSEKTGSTAKDSDKPDILRKRTKEHLPLPKLPPGIVRRGRASTSSQPKQQKQEAPKDFRSANLSAPSIPPPPVPPVYPAEGQSHDAPPSLAHGSTEPLVRKTTSRGKGQNKGGRLDKTAIQAATSDDKQDKDPLSLLADVSASVRPPSDNNSHDEDDYEEEL